MGKEPTTRVNEQCECCKQGRCAQLLSKVGTRGFGVHMTHVTVSWSGKLTGWELLGSLSAVNRIGVSGELLHSGLDRNVLGDNYWGGMRVVILLGRGVCVLQTGATSEDECWLTVWLLGCG